MDERFLCSRLNGFGLLYIVQFPPWQFYRDSTLLSTVFSPSKILGKLYKILAYFVIRHRGRNAPVAWSRNDVLAQLEVGKRAWFGLAASLSSKCFISGVIWKLAKLCLAAAWPVAPAHKDVVVVFPPHR